MPRRSCPGWNGDDEQIGPRCACRPLRITALGEALGSPLPWISEAACPWGTGVSFTAAPPHRAGARHIQYVMSLTNRAGGGEKPAACTTGTPDLPNLHRPRDNRDIRCPNTCEGPPPVPVADLHTVSSVGTAGFEPTTP